MTTINEIAQIAGVSRSTVSRVINHDPNVSDRTRVKVQAIIDENVVIPHGEEVGYNLEEDRKKGYAVTESGIVVVPGRKKVCPL